ncbi:7-carboxy-7-deazaguanine synthase [Portibacter lacus]|uniref:7-carboxy-7-deazaguanine synthase n=1 Tax=Portibacter lacus TaxID=1099794 RepID=A0AA37SMG6_9BACT|nr:7-carboxy-7-deazaguanine synthase [Portibacter lacus]GLR16630.1 7-carboxy-7-deazaguanine synthase [Portibacter lacus]
MKYAVKEIFYTLQGEGAHSGRPAVFLRFSGCNLWSGREEDRYKAICQFCDTDFWGTDGHNGGKYTAEELATFVNDLWPENAGHKYIVCTGGEPLLQLNSALIKELHYHGFEIAIETNGTLPVPEGVDWVCMSPKANTEIVVTKGSEIKIVFPQKGINPKDFEQFDFEHYFIQPMDSEEQEENILQSILFCKENPRWRVSVQTHKILGIA